MTAIAKIKFKQGAIIGVAGRALVGTVAGGLVEIENDTSTDITHYKIIVMDAPVGSGLTPGQVLVDANGSTPYASFTWPLAVYGTTQIRLILNNTDSPIFNPLTTIYDDRDFIIEGPGAGWKLPSYLSTTSTFNYGGQTQGWKPAIDSILRDLYAGFGAHVIIWAPGKPETFNQFSTFAKVWDAFTQTNGQVDIYVDFSIATEALPVGDLTAGPIVLDFESRVRLISDKVKLGSPTLTLDVSVLTVIKNLAVLENMVLKNTSAYDWGSTPQRRMVFDPFSKFFMVNATIDSDGNTPMIWVENPGYPGTRNDMEMYVLDGSLITDHSVQVDYNNSWLPQGPSLVVYCDKSTIEQTGIYSPVPGGCEIYTENSVIDGYLTIMRGIPESVVTYKPSSTVGENVCPTQAIGEYSDWNQVKRAFTYSNGPVTIAFSAGAASTNTVPLPIETVNLASRGSLVGAESSLSILQGRTTFRDPIVVKRLFLYRDDLSPTPIIDVYGVTKLEQCVLLTNPADAKIVPVVRLRTSGTLVVGEGTTIQGSPTTSSAASASSIDVLGSGSGSTIRMEPFSTINSNAIINSDMMGYYTLEKTCHSKFDSEQYFQPGAIYDWSTSHLTFGNSDLGASYKSWSNLMSVFSNSTTGIQQILISDGGAMYPSPDEYKIPFGTWDLQARGVLVGDVRSATSGAVGGNSINNRTLGFQQVSSSTSSTQFVNPKGIKNLYINRDNLVTPDGRGLFNFNLMAQECEIENCYFLQLDNKRITFDCSTTSGARTVIICRRSEFYGPNMFSSAGTADLRIYLLDGSRIGADCLSGAGVISVYCDDSSYIEPSQPNASNWSASCPRARVDPASEHPVITPTALAANQNDYAPTDWNTAALVRVSTNGADRTITGLLAVTPQDYNPKTGFKLHYKDIINVDSTYSITLSHSSSSSAAANRIVNPAGSDIVLGPYASARLYYDVTLAKWIILNNTQSVWEDYNVSPFVAATGSSVITYEPWRDVAGSISAYLRHDRDVYLSYNFELPHAWDQLSNLMLHMHYAPCATPPPSTDLVAYFLLKYCYTKNGDEIPADTGWTSTNISVTIPFSGADLFKYKYKALATIAPPATPGAGLWLKVLLARLGTNLSDTFKTSKTLNTSQANFAIGNCGIHYRLKRGGTPTDLG
jgi:hypothetical protein